MKSIHELTEVHSRERNWIDRAAEVIQSVEPGLLGCHQTISERLASLMIARLPEPVAQKLMHSIPSPSKRLYSSLSPAGDRTIGYPDFVEGALQRLMFEDARLRDTEELDATARAVADRFLIFMGEEFRDSLGEELRQALPAELSYRMGLRPNTDLRTVA